jgi:hypothetical protein
MRTLKIKSLAPKKEWIDKDAIMLHACFQLLEDYIEEEKGDIQCCYETHKDFVDELRSLYAWWQIRKKDIYSEDNSDDEMLLRLMKIRSFLWT